MKKLINCMIAVLTIATMSTFSMDWGREGVISNEHAKQIAEKEEERRLQQEREWQERRDRQDEADREQRKGIIFDIRRRNDDQKRY